VLNEFHITYRYIRELFCCHIYIYISVNTYKYFKKNAYLCSHFIRTRQFRIIFPSGERLFHYVIRWRLPDFGFFDDFMHPFDFFDDLGIIMPFDFLLDSGDVLTGTDIVVGVIVGVILGVILGAIVGVILGATLGVTMGATMGATVGATVELPWSYRGATVSGTLSGTDVGAVTGAVVSVGVLVPAEIGTASE
jgi:hypothetical protein